MTKSFLKWAGGKHRIMGYIKDSLPANGGRLIEPFIGGGSVFMGTSYDHYLLSDINPDLISLYTILQNDGDQFIDYCQTFFVPHNNNKAVFYAYRELFNDTKDNDLKAALFLYLNRHCFNGLCRYNKSGGFNVPFGFYERPYFPRKEMALFNQKAKRAQFVVSDFKQTMNQAKAGDHVYCDPPYLPLSTTANFTAYAGGSFTLDQQIELAAVAEELASRGAVVAISNHSTTLAHEIYKKADISVFPVQRSISARGKSRKKVSELIALYGHQHPQKTLF